jgi:hypothetical protein
VALRDGTNTLAETCLTIHVVPETAYDQAMRQLDRYPLAQDRLYGRRRYKDAQVGALLDEIEPRRGAFADLGFYTNDLLRYAGQVGVLEGEWEEASTRIGGLGCAWRTSKVYGPGGDPAARQRLKLGLYAALEAFTDRIPVAGEDVQIKGKPLSRNYGDGFAMLCGSTRVISYNFTSHPWRIYDPICGPALWLMPEIDAESRAGDAHARRLHERLVRFFQLAFCNPENYQAVTNPDGRWGQLTDTNHTEGGYADANLGHRLRAWLAMFGIWADYNRPITYVPNWYAGHFAQEAGPAFTFMPGWSPQGVLADVAFWVNHFHRPAHRFEQSGFHPDGTVSHHLPGCSDIAMQAYGYGWLTEVIDGYELLRDLPVELDRRGYQFIADRFLYSYDRMIYRGALDFTVCGRGYAGAMTGPVQEMIRDVDRLLAVRRPDTVISNAAALAAWRDQLVQKTHERSGNFPFWLGQFMAHRRGGAGERPYFCSVKMENDRTCGAEDFDRVRKSYHAGSGILQIKARGDEYEASRRGWDWHALPGLTEEWRTDAIGEGLAFGGSPFAGMASDGRCGFAAMEYRAHSGQYASARADKAFFFTDTEAVALGCGVARVNPGQGREIITTIDQALWAGDVTYSIDGAAAAVIPRGTAVDLTVRLRKPSWIHQGSVGYVIVPPGEQSLHIRGGDRVNATEPGGPGGASVIHFALGHGVEPGKDGPDAYCYIAIPNRVAVDMPGAHADVQKRIALLANGDGVQGIADRSADLLQLAFHRAGACTGAPGATISADRPVLVQVRGEREAWAIGITDPLHDVNARAVNLQLPYPLRPGTYPYALGGIYPQPGEAVVVQAKSGGCMVTAQLPDLTDDARCSFQAPLYAGMPIQVRIPKNAP